MTKLRSCISWIYTRHQQYCCVGVPYGRLYSNSKRYLNLIERFWGFMKRKVIYNRYYEKLAYFKMAVMDFFRNIDQHDAAIQSLMTENFGIMKT